MDSVGAGGAPDAAAFGDDGANTLGHIAEACAAGRAETGAPAPSDAPPRCPGPRRRRAAASGATMPGFTAEPRGLWGAAQECRAARTRPRALGTGRRPRPLGLDLLPRHHPRLPARSRGPRLPPCGTEGILGNCHASGVPIIAEHCEAHLRTLWPICYTSADSVFQIAAHEEAFGLDRLLKLCADLAPHLHALRVGRVIARPFTGTCGDFRRTANRRDSPSPPPPPPSGPRGGRGPRHPRHRQDRRHLLDAGHRASAQGQVGRRPLRTSRPPRARREPGFPDLRELRRVRHPLRPPPRRLRLRPRAGMVRRPGPPLPRRPRPRDLAIFTADHGNDPTWRGTEHTRERVPVVGPAPAPHAIGLRAFADVGATLAAHLGLPPAGQGPASCPDRPVRRERIGCLSLFFIPTGFRCLRLVRLGCRPPIRI